MPIKPLTQQPRLIKSTLPAESLREYACWREPDALALQSAAIDFGGHIDNQDITAIDLYWEMCSAIDDLTQHLEKVSQL